MKRRSKSTNDADAEREAMAELQRATGGGQPRPAAPGRPSAWGAAREQDRAGGRDERPPAWGASRQPAWQPEPEPEPAWEPPRQRAVGTRGRSAPPPAPWEVDDEDEPDPGEGWDREDPTYEDDGPVGLLGVPLDYDATGIALEQLAQRSNIRRPADMVIGVDAMEAEMVRDRAMAQFLERQQVRGREDAERAAARAAATGDAPTKRAAFGPLSPGLSAKSLVMQPVAAPPLNLPGSTSISPALLAAHADARAEAAEVERGRPERATPASTRSAGARTVRSRGSTTPEAEAGPPARKAPTARASTRKPAVPAKAVVKPTTTKAVATKKQAASTKAVATKKQAASTKAAATKKQAASTKAAASKSAVKATTSRKAMASKAAPAAKAPPKKALPAAKAGPAKKAVTAKKGGTKAAAKPSVSRRASR